MRRRSWGLYFLSRDSPHFTSGRQRRETPAAPTQIASGSLYDTNLYRIVYWMLGRWRLTVKEAAELSRW